MRLAGQWGAGTLLSLFTTVSAFSPPGCWESELGSSCLCDRHLANGTIFPAAIILLNAMMVRVVLTKLFHLNFNEHSYWKANICSWLCPLPELPLRCTVHAVGLKACWRCRVPHTTGCLFCKGRWKLGSASLQEWHLNGHGYKWGIFGVWKDIYFRH